MSAYQTTSKYDYNIDDFDNGENDGLYGNNDTNENVSLPEFEKRTCIKFVASLDEQADDICAHCKRPYSSHTDGTIQIDVNYKTRPNLYKHCTRTERTDAVGELLFPGAYCKKAKYIKVKIDTSIEQMAEYLFSETGFNLNQPKLMLSVTGRIKHLFFDDEIKLALKTGLMKIAKSTDAWIVSGGTNVGVMRLVGDAVAEEFESDELPVIGIASWGVIVDSDESLTFPNVNQSLDSIHQYVVRYFPEQKNNAMVALNPNHSHFIFVDDGSIGEYGVEIDFRTELEAYIVSESNIPMVLIVIGGGLHTLKTIYNAISKMFPVIIVAKSGYAADLVINALNNHQKDLNELLNFYEFDEVTIDEKESYLVYLKEIINEKNSRYLNIFEVREAGSSRSIEPTILDALSRAEIDVYNKIQLAIKWDRFDIVKTEIKNNRTNGKLDCEQLENLLESALIENKPKMVALILEHEANLVHFSTIGRLKSLYNNELKQRKVRYDEPFLLYLEKKKLGLIRNDEFNLKRTSITEILPQHIVKFLKSLFITFDPNKFIPENFDRENLENRIPEPELNLFIWCILSNRIEIAKIFWHLGKYQICYALMASKMLKFLSINLPELVEDLEQSANEFEDLAIGIVKIFDDNTRDSLTDTIIVRYLEPVKMDCLELAVNCDCKKFLSQTSIQKVLDGLWCGTGYDNNQLTDFENSLRNCQKMLNNKESYTFNNDNICQIRSNMSRWERMVKYMKIPYFRFILSWITYLIFLSLFSYNLLFNFKQKNSEKLQDKSDNKSNNSILDSSKFTFYNTNISLYEIVLLFWIFSLLIEEIRQCFFSAVVRNITWEYKMKNYFINEQWNILDIFGCVLFIIGFILKDLSVNWSYLFDWARIILSVDLILWFIRGLHFCLLVETLGPKLVMIRKMVDDLKYFLIIVLTFVISFGISLQVIVNAQDSFDPESLIGILNIAYWPIYGEITLLDKLKDECTDEDKTCPKTNSRIVAYFLLMVYLLIANVLLLNILIAMFSSTFETIQNSAALIWKNQRYHLISEYTGAPLPPPLNLINTIWYGIKKLKNKIKAKKEFLNHNSEINYQYQNYDILLNFEQKCTEKLLKEIRSKQNELKEDKIAILTEKVDELEKQLQQFIENT